MRQSSSSLTVCVQKCALFHLPATAALQTKGEEQHWEAKIMLLESGGLLSSGARERRRGGTIIHANYAVKVKMVYGRFRL